MASTGMLLTSKMLEKKGDHLVSEECYKSLAAAVLVRAIDDYSLFKGKNAYKVIQHDDTIYRMELERFFRSGWCSDLLAGCSNYAIEWLMDRVKVGGA